MAVLGRIEHYSVAYLIALLCLKRSSAELLLRAGLNAPCKFYPAHMSPALNRSSTLERFERSNASEIHNGIMFNFYPGLPHI